MFSCRFPVCPFVRLHLWCLTAEMGHQGMMTSKVGKLNTHQTFKVGRLNTHEKLCFEIAWCMPFCTWHFACHFVQIWTPMSGMVSNLNYISKYDGYHFFLGKMGLIL